MRHGNKINHLGVKAGHRRALLANLANSLILHKRIETTLAKAKELRVYVEPLITKSKNDTTHSRRTVFSYLKNKYAVKELFSAVVGKVGQRPGGYTRILKTGFRHGDAAEMALIELVDFNETYNVASQKSTAKKATRRGSSKKSTAASDTKVVDEAPKVAEAQAGEAPAPQEAVTPVEE
ncbi:MAG: 50S ribosomal protein L17 [Prevotellaceae bacterium]|jgi:large subunit ribosomal protein L17|nr:50S ribosomal protein L17 [Prevotellaceae bacterium]